MFPDNWMFPSKIYIQKLKGFQFHPENNPEINIPNLALFKLDGKMQNLKSTDIQGLVWFFPQDKSGSNLFDLSSLVCVTLNIST